MLKTAILIPVTVVEAANNVVLQKKSVESDGYEAIQLGFEDKREKLATNLKKDMLQKQTLLLSASFANSAELT